MTMMALSTAVSGAVGIFGKVFMARSVEQVEDQILMLEGHHR